MNITPKSIAIITFIACMICPVHVWGNPIAPYEVYKVKEQLTIFCYESYSEIEMELEYRIHENYPTDNSENIVIISIPVYVPAKWHEVHKKEVLEEVFKIEEAFKISLKVGEQFFKPVRFLSSDYYGPPNFPIPRKDMYAYWIVYAFPSGHIKKNEIIKIRYIQPNCHEKNINWMYYTPIFENVKRLLRFSDEKLNADFSCRILAGKDLKILRRSKNKNVHFENDTEIRLRPNHLELVQIEIIKNANSHDSQDMSQP